LRDALPAQFARRQTCKDDGEVLRQCREDAEPSQGITKDFQLGVGEEGGDRRVDDVSPREVTTIIKREQFVAVKSVLAIGYGVQEKDEKGQ